MNATRREPTRRVSRWAVVAYDRVYRLLHGLDKPEAEIGSAIRLEIRSSRRTRTLPDGSVVKRGERIGILHLSNERLAALHDDGLAPLAVGLAFRRQFLTSLRELARLVEDGTLGDVRAVAATTIFHEGLARVGFESEPGGTLWPRLVGIYQRRLLAALRPRAVPRLRRAGYHYARRLWLSRERLLARYGPRPGDAT